ncbi:MAG: uroporphyrinogen-III synthase [Bacteroidota bacterium]
MTRIFVSRALKPNSPFFSQLDKDQFEISHFSLIDFHKIAFSQVPKTDWIFFYSSKGVTFFFEQVKELEIPLNKDLKWAAMGKGTAATLSPFVPKVDFIGFGQPEKTAAAFHELLQDQRVLFPRAMHSAQSIQKLLGKGKNTIDLIVYKNEPQKRVSIPHCDIAVLTSSINATCFIDCYQAPENDWPVLIAIGEPTAKTIQKSIHIDALIPQEPSETAIVKLIQKRSYDKS